MCKVPLLEEEEVDVALKDTLKTKESLLMNVIHGLEETPCQACKYRQKASSAVSVPISGTAFFVPSLPHKPATLDQLSFQYEVPLLLLPHSQGSAHVFADKFPFHSRFFFPAETTLPPEVSPDFLESICFPFPPSMPVHTTDHRLVPDPAPLDVLFTPLNATAVLVEVVLYDETFWEITRETSRREHLMPLLDGEKEEVGVSLLFNTRPTTPSRYANPPCSSPSCHCVLPLLKLPPRTTSSSSCFCRTRCCGN